MNPFSPDWNPGEEPVSPPKHRPMPCNGLFDRLLRRRDLPDAVRVPALLLLGTFADLEQAALCSLDVVGDGIHHCRKYLECLRKGGPR